MKKSNKPKKPAAQPESSYTVHRLSALTGADRKTIDKAIVRAQIKPVRYVKSFPQYRLEDIQAALAAKPDKTLKDELLIEQIRKIRNANDRAEGKVILKDVVASAVGSTFASAAGILRQKLEAEFPAMCVGLDMNGLRAKGKQLYDDTIKEFAKLAELWPAGA